MERIRKNGEYGMGYGLSLHDRLETIRQRVAGGIKWWAEHQAWPATDEIASIASRRPWLTMAPHTTAMSDVTRSLLAAGASLLFSLACLGAALDPDRSECAIAIALDCPARL